MPTDTSNLEPFAMMRALRDTETTGIGVPETAEDYNLATGPSQPVKHRGRQASPRQLRTPFDLMHSRRAGLRRQTCIGCGAVRGEKTVHDRNCHAVVLPHMEAYWQRETTGPIAPDQTSLDTGWSVV